MKRITVVCTTLLLAFCLDASADDAIKAKKCSPEFERMKTLVGTWKGKADMGEGPVDMTVHYRVLAAGSVLEERVFAGTPNEMVTMYYDEGGKLAMTHYCMLGNRPAMLLKSSDKNSITMTLDPRCGIDTEKESYMHGVTIRFVDAETIKTSCQAKMEGKPAPEHEITLKKVSHTGSDKAGS